jgi:hypothetical protein
MVLSLFFSVTSALVSTLIQQWAREYLQYTQPSAAPHKRGRMRAYLHDGLIQFQMKRLTYGVPVLLHLSVFLFFYAISEWLYSINVPVGATARYSLVALFAVYMALSVLPLIVQNAPYQTALTTPLRACVSLIQISYIGLRQLVLRSSRVYEGRQKGSGLFKSVHVDRAQALMKEIKKRASELDRSAMHWLLQELDEDDMDNFLTGLPGYIHSPLTDKSLVVEGLIEDGLPGRISEHITTCLSLDLSPEESMSRASVCINSLRLISETASIVAVRRPGLENKDIHAIMEYLEPLCYNSSTALRASCIRGLVIREFLIPLADLDAEEILTKKFPDYLMPLYRVIRVWKTTETTQWSSHLTGTLTATGHPLPSDQEMWADVICDGPLINVAVLAYAILLRVDEEDVNFDMALRMIETLVMSLGLAQVQASAPALIRFNEILTRLDEIISKGVSGNERGITQVVPLLEALKITISGLHLAMAFAHTPKPMLLPRQIEIIFGPEQLQNSELLVAFAAHLPRFVGANTPEDSKSFMEHLILKNKLWEQLTFSLSRCFEPQVPFPDKLRIITAFFDIFDVAFDILNESSRIDWQSSDLTRLYRFIEYFTTKGDAPGELFKKIARFRLLNFCVQYCHALLVQFSMQRSRGEPLVVGRLPSLRVLVGVLGLGGREDVENLTVGGVGSARTGIGRAMKCNATLTVVLRDGPMSTFFLSAHSIFDMLVTELSDVTLEVETLFKFLKRLLDTPQLQLANASREKWAAFDHLRAGVRNAMEGNSQNAEKYQPLLDMIEKVHGMRPPTDDRAERTGNDDNLTRVDGPLGQGARQPGGALIPGSSGRGMASHPAAEGQIPFRPVLGTAPTAGMGQVNPRGWGLTRQSNLGPVSAKRSSTSSIPTVYPGFGVETSVPGAQANPQSFASASVPQNFASPLVPQRFASANVPESLALPHVPGAYPLDFASQHFPGTRVDPTNPRAQAYMQPGVAGIPWHMLSNQYPSPGPSPGTIGALPPADEEQLNLINGDENGCC